MRFRDRTNDAAFGIVLCATCLLTALVVGCSVKRTTVYVPAAAADYPPRPQSSPQEPVGCPCRGCRCKVEYDEAQKGWYCPCINKQIPAGAIPPAVE